MAPEGPFLVGVFCSATGGCHKTQGSLEVPTPEAAARLPGALALQGDRQVGRAAGMAAAGHTLRAGGCSSAKGSVCRLGTLPSWQPAMCQAPSTELEQAP